MDDFCSSCRSPWGRRFSSISRCPVNRRSGSGFAPPLAALAALVGVVALSAGPAGGRLGAGGRTSVLPGRNGAPPLNRRFCPGAAWGHRKFPAPSRRIDLLPEWTAHHPGAPQPERRASPAPRHPGASARRRRHASDAWRRRYEPRALLFGPERPAYPGGWDQGRQDFFTGLDASGFAIAPVTVIAPAQPGTLARRLQALRQSIAARILATLPIATGSIAVTLLTGDEQTIPPAGAERLHRRRAGAYPGGGGAACRHRHGAGLRRHAVSPHPV